MNIWAAILVGCLLTASVGSVIMILFLCKIAAWSDERLAEMDRRDLK